MHRRFPTSLVLPSLLVLLVMTGLPGCAREPPEPRNVVLLFVDTLRADRTSVNGYVRQTTPCLERFAATATTFEHAYSPSSWTRTSFASYLTGLYPSVHGCEGDQGYLDHGLATLAELFKARGYATAGIIANENIGASWGFAQGFDLYEHPPPDVGYPGDVLVTGGDAVAERVVRWLRTERPDGPWFLFVLMIDPHDPYLPHPEHDPGPPPVPGVEGSRRYLDAFDDDADDSLSVRIKLYIRDLYDGEVFHADSRMGAILDEIDAEGLAPTTLVAVSSDHGEGLWDHMHYRKHGRMVFEEQIHVPLIVRWPGHTKPGMRVTEPVGVMDLFGALAETYHLAPRSSYQAGSLLDLLEPDARTRPIYAEQRLYDTNFRVMVDWPWKLIRDDAWDHSWACDLSTNPHELRDDRPEALKRAKEMTRDIDAFSARNAEFRSRIAFTGERITVDPETVRELRALGY